MEKEYTSCYIAFLDILGFKRKIEECSCEDIFQIYQHIKNPSGDIVLGGDSGNIQKIDLRQTVKMKIMSDSICFYIDEKVPNALFCLLVCCGAFQSSLLNLSNPVLVRGAITVGNIFAEGDITFGPGLTDGYLMESKCAKYPRIILTKETLDSGMKNADSLVRENVDGLAFCDFDEFYSVEYVDMVDGSAPIEEKWAKVYERIRKVLDSEKDNAIREKYLYLKKRISSRCKAQDIQHEINLQRNH